MKKFRLFMTIFFLFTALIIFLYIAVFDRTFFLRAVNEIQNYLWPAAITLFIFLLLLTAGIVSNSSSIEGRLFANGYFQLAILELFLIAAGLAWYRNYTREPGQIVFKLESEKTRAYVYLGVKYQSEGEVITDTVRAPGKLIKRPAGKYSIETIDRDIVHYQKEIVLKPAATETLIIPVNLNVKTLSVNTEPTGAEIWINGLLATETPYVFDILTGDTVVLDVKMDGYQTYSDTISLIEDVDLGIIPLRKLFTLWITSRYADIRYNIIDWDDKLVFSSYGSRKLQLPQGNYRISYEIGEGQYEIKRISLTCNQTVLIP